MLKRLHFQRQLHLPLAAPAARAALHCAPSIVPVTEWRWRWRLLLSIFLLSTCVTARAADESGWQLWVCAYSDKAVTSGSATSRISLRIPKDSSWQFLIGPHASCVLPPAPKKSPLKDAIHEASVREFLSKSKIPLSEVQRGQAGVILCHDGAIGKVQLAKGLPTPKGAAASCAAPVIPTGTGRQRGTTDGSVGGGGIFPNNPWTTNVPKSSDLACSARGSLNPWAKADGTTGTTGGDIAAEFARAWITGTATASATAKAALMSTSGTGTTTLFGAAGTAALVSWGNTAASALGDLLEGRYKTQAESLARQAEGFAKEAALYAVEAEEKSTQDAANAALAEAAKLAREAADAAAKAAKEARKAAEEAAKAKTRADVAAAYERAKRAAEEAAKKAAEAKAKEGTTTESSGKDGKSPSDKADKLGGSSSALQACERLRRQTWECEQMGWKTFSCEQLTRTFQGCRMDVTVALVDPDSAICGKPTASREALDALTGNGCGMIVARRGGPSDEPCDGTMPHSPVIHGGCDPTVDGCSQEPDAVILPQSSTVCFPAPPSAPPMPCIDTQAPPGGGPLERGFIQDNQGTVFLVNRGGIVVLGVGYPPRPR